MRSDPLALSDAAHDCSQNPCLNCTVCNASLRLCSAIHSALLFAAADDNGTFACSGAGSGAKNHWLCYDMNIRDFDLLGYKYSLLSTIGTAGLNLVRTILDQ